MSVPVPLNRPPSSTACAYLLCELIKHYLYMRSQIPGLFDDLYWQAEVRGHISRNTLQHSAAARYCQHAVADNCDFLPAQPVQACVQVVKDCFTARPGGSLAPCMPTWKIEVEDHPLSLPHLTEGM